MPTATEQMNLAHEQLLQELNSELSHVGSLIRNKAVEFLEKAVESLERSCDIQNTKHQALYSDGESDEPETGEDLGTRISILANHIMNTRTMPLATVPLSAVKLRGPVTPHNISYLAEKEAKGDMSWNDLPKCDWIYHPKSTIDLSVLVPDSDDSLSLSLAEAVQCYGKKERAEMRIRREKESYDAKMLEEWGGKKLTFEGILLLLHLCVGQPVESLNETAPSYVITFCIIIFLAFVKDAITILGRGRSPDACHIVKFPLPDLMIHGIIGSQSDECYLDRCALLAYVTGYLGPLQVFSPFHGPRGQKSVYEELNRERPNALYSTADNRNPFALNNTGGLIHKRRHGIMIERRNILRIFAFLNLCGFQRAVPRLGSISKQFIRTGEFADAFLTKGLAIGARTHCFSSLLNDFPFLLIGNSKFKAIDILGSGSEKTVFLVRRDSSDMNIAVRLNTPTLEFKLTRICANAEGLSTCINHYIGKHLTAPLMSSADRVISTKNSHLEIFQFIRSVCSQLIALNSADFIHRDIKLGNILALDRGSEPTWYLLSDFGHNSRLGYIVTCSSRTYADPCHVHCPATEKLDIWCLALSILKLLGQMSMQAKKVQGRDLSDCTFHKVKRWYRGFLEEKEVLKSGRSKQNGNLTNPKYLELIKYWGQQWDWYIWSRLIPIYAAPKLPHLDFDSKDTDCGHRLKKDILPALRFMGVTTCNSDEPRPSGFDTVVGLDLILALRNCMEIVHIDKRWGPVQLLNFSEYWITQIKDQSSWSSLSSFF